MIGYLIDAACESLLAMCRSDEERALLDSVFDSMTDEQLMNVITAETVKLLRQRPPDAGLIVTLN